MRYLQTWTLIQKSIAEKIPVMLLYVLESQGSSPGRQGFFMAVNINGEMQGSIGGGIMEHKFVELAKERLGSGITETGIRKQIHDKAAGQNQSGMICSGEQTVLLYALQEADAAAVNLIIDSISQSQNGTLELSPAGIQFTNRIPEDDFEYQFQSENDWIYREKTGYKNQLSVIGGGHCSLALCELMHKLDFYIRVYDDRSNLKTMEENHFVQEKILLKDYNELHALIHPGPHHYAVIMTFGYRTDEMALHALKDKSFTYLGMLGSRTKMEKMLSAFREKGIHELLNGIYSPVGIDIKSQTPEEIAVSIAAEIIGVKNRLL